MTYGEAKKMGYVNTFTSLERGYLSRKTDVDKQEVLQGKKGLYVLLPNWRSNNYCIRQYIEKK